MKSIKILLTVALAFMGVSAFAQDFSDPKYAKWGDTPEERKENMMNSTFFKEAINNRQYELAAGYLQSLVAKCPKASENIYVNGVKLYKARIGRAQSVAEKKMFIDSLLWVYDARLEAFANHSTRGKVYILSNKAREILTYMDEDREAVRNAFKASINAQKESNGKAEPEDVAIYFKNLCDDYVNDEVGAMEVVNAYDELASTFDNVSDEQVKFKEQFETCFARSGAASSDNIEKIYAAKVAETPTNEVLLAQVWNLLVKAKSTSDFYISVGEKYYAVNPLSNVAMTLARTFQDRKEYSKANHYLREALSKETDDNEREKLLVRIGILDVTQNNYREAVDVLRTALKINPDDGLAIYFLAQCYVAGATGCSGLAKDAIFWVANDLLQRAIPLLQADEAQADVAENASKLAASYRSAFPTKEECFFNELDEGSTYTVNCGFASGVQTRVRYRP